jgi:hypothetical protein
VDTDTCFVALNLPGFFTGQSRGKPKPLTIYAALYPVDVSRLTIKEGRLTGPFTVTVAGIIKFRKTSDRIVINGRPHTL